ncbi:hypothetical protein, partial [Neisseria sicca]|uniref:hypothetical protein n=1 Tax=Neisseria sicca TaxID=490 RepID=UPI001C996836
FLWDGGMDVELSEEKGERVVIPGEDFWGERMVNDGVLGKLVLEGRQRWQRMVGAIEKLVRGGYLVLRGGERELVGAEEKFGKRWEKVGWKVEALEERLWRIGRILDGN